MSDIKTELLPTGALKWNKNETKEEIKELVAKYDHCVITVDNAKDYKKDLAELRKVSKGISDKRIEVKKQLTEPLTIFENEIKEVVKPLEDTINTINVQLKEVENAQKEEKRAKIEKLKKEMLDELEINTDLIFNEKWLNASTKISDIEYDLSSKKINIEQDIKVLSKMPTKSKEMVEMYKQNLDMQKTIDYFEQLEKIEEKVKEPKEEVQEPKEKVQEPIVQEDKQVFALKVKCTLSQAKKIKEYLIKQGIEIL